MKNWHCVEGFSRVCELEFADDSVTILDKNEDLAFEMDLSKAVGSEFFAVRGRLPTTLRQPNSVLPFNIYRSAVLSARQLNVPQSFPNII